MLRQVLVQLRCCTNDIDDLDGRRQHMHSATVGPLPATNVNQQHPSPVNYGYPGPAKNCHATYAVPKISEETIQNFNYEEQKLLRNIPDGKIDELGLRKLETNNFLSMAIEGFEQCFLDENYPQNEHVEIFSHQYFELILRTHKNIKQQQRKPATLFSKQLLDLFFKLFESNRKEVFPPLKELVKLSKDVITLKGIENEFSQQYMPKVLEILREADTSDFKIIRKVNNKTEIMRSFMVDCVIGNIESVEGKLSKDMLTYTLACFEKLTIDKLDHIQKIFTKKGIIWKKHKEGAVKVLKEFLMIRPYKEVRYELDERENGYTYDEEEEDYIVNDRHPYLVYVNNLKWVMISLCKSFNGQKVLKNKEIQTGLADVLLSSIRHYKKLYYTMAVYIPSNINSWEDCEDVILDILKAINECLRADNFKPFPGNIQKELYTETLSRLCIYIKENNPVKYSEALYKIFNFCVEQDLGNEKGIHGEIVINILRFFVNQNRTGKSYQKFVPHVFELSKKDNEDISNDISELAEKCISHFDISPNQETAQGTTTNSGVIDSFCSTKNSQQLAPFYNKPFTGQIEEEVMKKLDDFMAVKISKSDHSSYIYYHLLLSVSKKYPKRAIAYRDIYLRGLDDLDGANFAIMGVAELCAHEPSQFIDQIERLVHLVESQPNMIYYITSCLAEIALSSENEGKKIMPMIIKLFNDGDPVQKSAVLGVIKTIAMKRKDYVIKYTKDLEKCKDTPGAPYLDALVESVIDVLEGRSLKTVTRKVEENKEDVEQLDERVTNAEDDVKELDSKVDNQQKDLDTVKEDVKEQGEKFDDLEEVVGETVEKVEEIDHKTLSSAPAWSRDVSLLLNPESDSDWRFIAIRLGYSPEDIRNWATAHDPTMSMLSEWYTTHKSSDATYAVLTSLKELGRNDCADVIEKALKDADQTVPGPPPEMTHPPPIFISYQWDHQSEVKAIRTHLEMAGYECWMDIGQMGGGDKLYEKIDEGMRGAKVVLSMCTSKYAQSKNCNHEVNLASLLNKPIIPIILEDIPWPPPGAMSMLFSQLLYIDFKSDQGTEGGEKFWTDAKFFELLGQITYYVAPDPEKIANEYKNWVPKVEEPAPKLKNSSRTRSTSNTQEIKSKTDKSQEPEVVDPEVFISYQWDKQPEVKKLYGKLTDIGFTCWLDINQMGGGDALYGKIDRGVRKAKVVVSCVTTKYALSANCRREVSLSDALRKPIIPILLEETAWPPEGPMSMPFAQLLYIDFTRQNSQQFNDEKFKELLSKLQEYSEPIKKI